MAAHGAGPGPERERTYVWAQDIVGDWGLVDARVLVGLEVDEGILGYALGDGLF